MRNKNIQARAYKYGLTYDECVRLLKTTECGICGKKNLEGRNQHIDHDHDTGAVRGILCASCNVKVGFVEKNIYSLHVFARYAGYDLEKIIQIEKNTYYE